MNFKSAYEQLQYYMDAEILDYLASLPVDVEANRIAKVFAAGITEAPFDGSNQLKKYWKKVTEK